MLRKKCEYILCSFYDRTGIQAHMEQMAAKGWMLEKMSRFFWTYRRAEPKAMHFSVVYFAPASEFDCAPGEVLTPHALRLPPQGINYERH